MSGTLGHRLAWRDEQRFVGREAELAFFDRLLVDDPPASVVIVHGPGGIGKSTLLREVARRGERRGFTPHFVEGRELAPVPGELERAIAGVELHDRPLLLFDTYELMSAAGGYLRTRLLPSLPERSLVVLAGRAAPEPEWMQGGWEQLTVELELEPFGHEDALELMEGMGLHDGPAAERLIDWAEGSPLALSLAAGAVRDGAALGDGGEDPNLMRTILRRLAQTELDGGNLDVAAVAAIARVTSAQLLADVLPGVDPDEAEAWLRTRTFTEDVGGGVTLHELVRRAMRADLRARDPEHERALRRAIADHLYARAVRGESRLLTDLAELVDNPTLRWGFGAEGSVRYRVDTARDDDTAVAASLVVARAGDAWWWDQMRPFFETARDRVIVARDASDHVCGVCIAVTPANAPALAEQDILLGPWLAHAREHHPDGDVVLWRDAIDFTAPAEGDLASPVLAVMNTAAIMRSGVANPSFSYLPIDPRNEAAAQFAANVGAEHVSELDVRHDRRVVECHIVGHGEGGILGGVRNAVYGELGLTPPTHSQVAAVFAATTTDAGAPAAQADPAALTVEHVRDALRNLGRPMDLAVNPLAEGTTPDERAASVRNTIEDAIAGAFGAAHDEQFMRQILERAYLDPAPSHELAADELNVSRATYFRRLRAASQRLADYLTAVRGD